MNHTNVVHALSRPLADDNFDEFSAETLAAIDNELQQIKMALLQRFPQLDLSSVFPIGQVITSLDPLVRTCEVVWL